MKKRFMSFAKTFAPLMLIAALGTGSAFAAGRGGFGSHAGGRAVSPRGFSSGHVFVAPRYRAPGIGFGFGIGVYPYAYAPYYAPYGYAVPFGYATPYGYPPPACGGYYDQNGVWQSQGCVAPAPLPAPGASYGY